MKKKLMADALQHTAQTKKKRKEEEDEAPDTGSLFAGARSPHTHGRRASLEGTEEATTMTTKSVQLVAKTVQPGSKIGALLSTTTPTPPKPAASSKIHANRLKKLLNAAEKKEKADEEMKENESAPSPHVAASKLKKKQKLAEKESASSSVASTELSKTRQKSAVKKSLSSSSPTTSTLKEKKKSPQMNVRNRQLDRNGNGVVAKRAARQQEKDERACGANDEEWPSMTAFVPVRGEGSSERKRVKVARKLAKKRQETTRKEPDEEVAPQVAGRKDTVPDRSPGSKSIDKARRTKEVTVAQTSRMNNGKLMRHSSPEVSSTSSDSSDDDKARRKKVLTKKRPVTSSSPKDEAMKSRKKTKTRSETEEQQPQPVRPSSDLLQMVAARLANSHGLLVFRLISAETRRIAARQLRLADDVLHLEQFDDENAFTRDDMAAWWEDRREAEDTSVPEGKENRSHAHISAYLKARCVERRLLRDMDGGISQPSSAAAAVDETQLLQHPLETLDAACLLHESQSAAAARLLQQEGATLREVWLGHGSAKLARELKRLTAIERFEHRQATMATLDRLPLLQMTELRLDIVDEERVSRAALADHLVNARSLRALELNVAPCGPLDGNTASQYTLFTRRCYDRADYTDDLEWMIPNVEDGEPDPVTLCMPSLEHLATNVGNVKLFWQLRDATLLLRHLQSLRVGTLSKTKELITSCELFTDTKEARRHKQTGFFALRDAHETVLESITLRLSDRVGVCTMQRDAATLFESIAELPPSLRRLSLSLFYNQFAGVCAPFRKWADPATEAPDTGHIRIEEMHLHFERAFDLRGLPALLPASIKTLSIALNYENDDDAKCLGPFLEMLPGLARLERLDDLHIQVWGVRCLQPLLDAVAACRDLATRLTRLALAAYPTDDAFFEPATFSSWLRSSAARFPRLCSFGLHASVLVRMIPAERRSGYSWRNGLARLANESLGDRVETPCARLDLTAARPLPALDDGEDYTITPHWEVEYDSAQLVLAPEDEEEREGIEDSSYAIPNASSDEDDFITDGEDEEEPDGDDAHDDRLEQMEEGLADETERLERRQQRRDEKIRAAIERGEMPEGEEEEEGEVVDFNSISDEEEDEAPKERNAFVDDEAVESDREESGDEEQEGKQEESAASSECSSDDEEHQMEERRQEEERRRKRRERKQAKLDNATEVRKRKRAVDSEDEHEEDDEMMIVNRRARPSHNKKKKVIIDSDEE